MTDEQIRRAVRRAERTYQMTREDEQVAHDAVLFLVIDELQVIGELLRSISERMPS